ncbi:hypothetical protein FQR65_LT07202 [Abscondita terminalis]|nr:hypothetical protein FQR65_LT07202 [Abscondita terminalis]
MEGNPECGGTSTESEDIDEANIVSVQLDDKELVTGYFFKNPIVKLEPPVKIQKISLSLRHDLLGPQFKEHFRTQWKNGSSFTDNQVELITDPFKVCVVKNILENKEILNKVVEEFYDIEWNKRSLDLYEFFQSVDLKKINFPNIGNVYDFLKNEVKNWIEALTDLELTDISATCSLYGHTDYLLVHDDQQEDRLIAFVLYFTGPRDWKIDNGGSLQLFSKDERGEPLTPVKNIFPQDNQFVFFQVTNDSYHQVAEVLSKEDCRMSINGWFHTRIPLKFNTPTVVIPDFGLFSNCNLEPKDVEIDFEFWIESDYLDLETAKSIQQQIEEESEISLQNFLTETAFNKILKELQDTLIWTGIGPPNRRSYEVLLEENASPLLKDFINLFSSHQMFDLLKHYSDLDLKTFRYELQRWVPQCYSLLSDYDWLSKNELDLIMYLGSDDLSACVVGGRTIYVAMEEEIQQALITLDPNENHLNIVYRDSARITKYTITKAEFWLYLNAQGDEYDTEMLAKSGGGDGLRPSYLVSSSGNNILHSINDDELLPPPLDVNLYKDFVNIIVATENPSAIPPELAEEAQNTIKIRIYQNQKSCTI